MWKRLRLCLALLCFVGFVLLFCDLSEHAFLASTLAWLAKIQLIPAILSGSMVLVLALVAVTLIFGRIYCSVVCPLGLLQDLLLSLRKQRSFRYLNPRSWLRLSVLAIFLVAMFVGLPFFLTLLEPYSAFGRIAADIGQPLAILINNAFDWLLRSSQNYAIRPHPLFSHGYLGLTVAMATLLILGYLTYAQGRVWCTHICPVGTMLGLLSRFALFRPRIDAELCRHCGQCENLCKANCIDAKASTVDVSRCVACLNCQNSCAFGALRFTVHMAQTPHEDRRRMLGRVAMGTLGLLAVPRSALAASSKRTEAEILSQGYKPRRRSDQPLLPAGARSLRHFAAHCTGCQACVAACPSQVLCSFDAGAGFLQASLSFAHGFCRPECTVCSQVCPTSAIQTISVEEKSSIQIGHAEIDTRLCVVKTDQITCTACQRNCPTGAIALVGQGELKEPAVNREKCIGCGACEYHCPARPVSAITVQGHSEHRQI
ncbi:MAG: 4Fe-4S dicluster domain-containing protein [Desulfovibrio sp.]|nr:4Fe-4S dicluster domain-containing protein [Desulfovibrio sp.]